MCGIVGIVSRDAVTERGWLPTGRDLLTHRGPDDAGEWSAPDGRAWFGSPPARDHRSSRRRASSRCDVARTQLSIVFNGEIYNYRELRRELESRGHAFRTRSDTEVILAATASGAPTVSTRLDGMFALAICDARAETLLLARDRAGEKPLFYLPTGGALRFASELKALLADGSLPRRVDPESFDCYLADGFVPGDRCMLHGFSKLPPAHALRFDAETGRTQIWRYWDLPRAPRDAAELGSEDELIDGLERVLEQAVRRQLVADVPVGVLLSGGVDSSLVTAMAARANPTVRTFTVRFPGHGSYDETEHARLIARAFGTDHVEIEAEAASVGLLPTLARQFDEPMVDSSMVPTYLLSRVVRAHCTVALGGDGGDELFGGYPHYDRMLRLARGAGRAPRFLRALLARAAGALPAGFTGRNWGQASRPTFAPASRRSRRSSIASRANACSVLAGAGSRSRSGCGPAASRLTPICSSVRRVSISRPIFPRICS